jgi:hypothetical protein
MNNTIQITQAELKRLGYWEDAKKRFNLNEENLVVNLMEGTTLYKDTPMTATPPPMICAVCGTQMVPMAAGGKGCQMCPACQGGGDRLDLKAPASRTVGM